MLKPVNELFKNEEKGEKLMSFLLNVKQYTPDKSNIFRPFRINEADLNMVIVNSQPHIDISASGLLFGCENPSETNVYYRNFTNSYAIHVANDIAFNEKAFDFTFSNFLEKNILMINVCAATIPYYIIGNNDINNKDSHTYFWKNLMMDEIFYYLNYFDKGLDFLFIGDQNNENINYYQKQITNFYHTIHRIPSFLTGIQNIKLITKYV